MYLEGDQTKNLRILRCNKNRFGSTGEIGIFEMTRKGLAEVKNPSEFFLKDRLPDVSGSITTVVIEGSRPILVEVQALASRTTFGYPKRSSSGIDLVRLQLLCAVIEARVGIPTSSYDIYVNIAGDLKVDERAVELAVALSIVSAIKRRPIDQKLVAFGEVGLSGEIRTVPQIWERIKESIRLGFKKIVCPKLDKKLKAKYNVLCDQELKTIIKDIL
jgi:DNA repair protein RadA/Sms